MSSEPTINHPSDTPARRWWLVALLLVASVVAVFGQVCGHEFLVWDDTWHVTENPHLDPVTSSGVGQFWRRPYWGLYIPLSYTFFAAEASIARLPLPDGGSGPNPIVFHLGNLVLHVACVWLVFTILRRLFRHTGAACAGALLFALHPVQVESVAWVSETRGVLCGVFSLLAVWQYMVHVDALRADRSAAKSYASATACFALALLCKPAAVAVPLIVAALDFGLLRRSLRQIVLGVGPWLLVSVAWVIVTKLQQPDRQLPFVPPIWARPLLAGDALAFYLVKLIAPWRLGPDYGRSPAWVMQQGWFYVAWLLPAAATAVPACLKNRRVWLTAAGISIAWLLPVLGLVPFVFQRISTVADRYLYLALLGPAVALSWFLANQWNRRTVAVVSVVLGILASCSFIQTRHWRDSDALLARGLQVNPRSGMMSLLQGIVLDTDGKPAEAIEIYSDALREHPEMVELHLGMAKSLSTLGRPDEAIEALRQAARRFPQEPLVHCELGILLAAEGAAEEAFRHFREALRLKPVFARAQFCWGKLLLDRGEARDAIRHFRSVLTIAPNHVPARINLGVALQGLNHLAEARHHYLKVIEIRAGDPAAHYNLANLLRLQGAVTEAIRHYRSALEADPEHVGAHVNLAITLYEQGKRSEADALFRDALRLVPPDSQQAGQIREALAGGDGWTSLFDGKKLGRWEVAQRFDFINHGKVEVKDGTLVLGKGKPGTAVRFTGKFPKIDYEVSLDAMRVDGGDFFCGMTFPVGDDALTLIVGGWRGPVVGLSCINGEPAVDNETCLYKEFKTKQWYRIRLRVTRERIQAWIDKEEVVDLATEDRKFSILFEPETALPLGIATWDTTGALRNIRVRRIGEKTD